MASTELPRIFGGSCRLAPAGVRVSGRAPAVAVLATGGMPDAAGGIVGAVVDGTLVTGMGAADRLQAMVSIASKPAASINLTRPGSFIVNSPEFSDIIN